MPNPLKRVKLQPRLQTDQPLAQPGQAVAWGSDLAGQIARPENAQQMLLIVRYKIVCLAGERLGYDAGIGRIVHGETRPVRSARRRFCLCLSLGVYLDRPRRSADFQSQGPTGRATRAGGSKCQNTI